MPRVAFGYSPENTVLEFLTSRIPHKNYDQLKWLYKSLLYSDLSTEVVHRDDNVYDVDFTKFDILSMAGEFFLNYYDDEEGALYKFIRNVVTPNVYRSVITSSIKVIPRVSIKDDTWIVFAFNVGNKPER